VIGGDFRMRFVVTAAIALVLILLGAIALYVLSARSMS
jgi:hypothetical protein